MDIDEYCLIRHVVSEMRAPELMRALRAAVNGSAHWRWEARNLLANIDDCVLPPLHEPHPYDEAA